MEVGEARARDASMYSCMFHEKFNAAFYLFLQKHFILCVKRRMKQSADLENVGYLIILIED